MSLDIKSKSITSYWTHIFEFYRFYISTGVIINLFCLLRMAETSINQNRIKENSEKENIDSNNSTNQKIATSANQNIATSSNQNVTTKESAGK